MDQNTFLDKHVEKINGLTFRKLIDKLNADVYGKEMRKDISDSVEALGSAVTELHDKGGSGSGVGWTDYQIGQLEKILKAAAYADTGIGDEINKLIASLRHIKVLTSLNIQGGNITLNAGDRLDSIKSMIHVYAVYDAGVPQEIDGYEIEGTLIPGKDCPVSISYTEGGITVTSTITVTVRERVPSSMTVRLFNNVESLPAGTTSAEIRDAIYAQINYNDGHAEVIQDLLLGDNTAVVGANKWTVTSGLDHQSKANLEFYGMRVSPAGNARVVYLLEGCSSTNTESEIAPGEAFKTVISADNGTIDSLKVFVDGTDFTGLVAPDGKTIDIQSIYVTTNGRIIISAKASTDYTITYHLTNCTSSNTDTTISWGSVYQTYIQPNDGYELDLEKTYATHGSTINSANEDGRIFIQNVTGDVNIYGVAKQASGGEVTLTSISASYTGGTVPAGTTLDQLKNYITVTAHYSDGSTAPVTDYSLSGALTAGQTNTITVTYQGKTATFEATVEASEVTLTSISVSYTGGTVAAGTTLEQLTGITVTATYSNGTTSTIPSSEYSLSGTLTSGQTNTITVSYSGKTATFEVTVEASAATENYELRFLEPNSNATNQANATGVQTFGDNQTYTTVSENIKTNKSAKISEKITYNPSKVYTITVTPKTAGVRFQLAYFDASDNLSGYSTWESSGDISDVGTIQCVFTLSGTTLTRDKAGTITSNTQSMGNAAWFAVYARVKADLIASPDQLTVTMDVTDVS